MNELNKPETPEAKAARKKFQAEDGERAMAEYRAAQSAAVARLKTQRAARLAREAKAATKSQ